MVECEICMEKFPIDCFEFFPCAHKICSFCYRNIKQLKCPYCRLDIEPPSEDENDNYNPEPPIIINRRRKKRNRNRSRNTYSSPENTSERFNNYNYLSN
tara:strand:- start:141 stop:437 length:297 start_codon:yes stop_codon:yes gene_type:complete